MSKRSHGEGTIYKWRDKWRAQITIDGRRLSAVRDTQAECRKWLRDLAGQVAKGLTYDAAHTSLQEYMTGWLKNKKESVRERTYVQYEYSVNKLIIPRIGGVKFKDLTPTRLQKFFDNLTSEGVPVRTIQIAHSVMHSCLQQAYRIGLILSNPSDTAIIPKRPPHEMVIWNEEEVSRFMVHVSGHLRENLYYLALYTGMRRGELLGLRWSDIDWANGILHVKRQLKAAHYGKNSEYTAPKTKHGIRTIDLGETAIQQLRNQLDKVMLMRASAKDWIEHDLVFPAFHGTPINTGVLAREFKQLCLDAKVSPIRFHDLRHTAASLMLNHGVPVIVVSRRLGHSTASVTMDIYAHLIPGFQREASNVMEGLLTPIDVTEQLKSKR